MEGNKNDRPMLLFHVEGVNNRTGKQYNILIDAAENKWPKAGSSWDPCSDFKLCTIVLNDYVDITDPMEKNTIGHKITKKRQFSLSHQCFVTQQQPTGDRNNGDDWNDDWKIDNTANPRVELIQILYTLLSALKYIFSFVGCWRYLIRRNLMDLYIPPNITHYFTQRKIRFQRLNISLMDFPLPGQISYRMMIDYKVCFYHKIPPLK